MKEATVILVDSKDNETGFIGKTEAHEKGLLHRAVSVFIVNTKGEWLIQQRAFGKYHSAGLWTNACCSHPFPGETTHEAASRRLKEEMGIACELHYLFNFSYRADFENGLSENELDHVFFGVCNELPQINDDEVESYQYFPFDELNKMVAQKPEDFTVWFKLIYQRVNEFLLK
jgi:isopentenyl-diphosphate delta-isomerase